MTKKLYDLAVATREYADRHGQQKTNWLRVGAVMEKDDGGRFILLDRTFNPAGVPNPDGRDTVLLSMFRPRQGQGNDQAGQSPQQSGAPSQDFDDQDIPF